MLFKKYLARPIVVAALMWLPAVSASTFGEANQLARELIQRTMKEQRIPGLQIAVIIAKLYKPL